MASKFITLTFVIEKEGRQYSAVCRELGTASCGDTVDEALENIREAVNVDLNTLEQIGERARIFRERGIKLRSHPQAAARVPVEVGQVVKKESIRLLVPA